MADDHGHSGAVAGVDRAFRGTVGREATAFGFSIVISATFALVQLEHGAPARWDIVLFAAGAGASFVLLTAAASRGFRRPLPQHRTEVVGFAAGLNLVSIMAAVATATGTAAMLGPGPAWPLCPLLSATVYLLVESLEELFAERVLVARDDRDAETVDD